jgi:hypothetical protein
VAIQSGDSAKQWAVSGVLDTLANRSGAKDIPAAVQHFPAVEWARFPAGWGAQDAQATKAASRRVGEMASAAERSARKMGPYTILLNYFGGSGELAGLEIRVLVVGVDVGEAFFL